MFVVQLQQFGCRRGEFGRVPTVDAGHVGAWDGRDSAVHCGGSAVGTH